MVARASRLGRDAREWAIDHILRPQLDDLMRSGVFIRSTRFACDEDAIAAEVKLIDTQLTFALEGRKQTMSALAGATGESAGQVRQLLAAIGDWMELADGLRMRPSDRGRVSFSGSAFVLKSAPHDTFGPRVFPACSRAFPVQVEEVLERHDLLPARPARRHSPATDSSLYLMEVGPQVTQAMRVKGLPEGTQWDPGGEERYPAAIRDEIAEALELAAGGPYTVETDSILRGEIFDPFLERLAAHGHGGELPRPVESGWVSFGSRGFEYRFLGGELRLVRYLQKKGLLPFLDLPRKVVERKPFKGARSSVPVPSLPVISDEDCVFEIPDGRCFQGEMLGWAAGVTFGSLPGSPRTANVFNPVSDATVEMAGGDVDEVEYAVTNARVGKAGSSKRFRIGLIVRNEGGSIGGWGIPGYDFRDDVVRRTAIEQTEEHVARMGPDGPFETKVRYLQDLGIQTMGILLASQREQREGLILAADALRSRAQLGV